MTTATKFKAGDRVLSHGGSSSGLTGTVVESAMVQFDSDSAAEELVWVEFSDGGGRMATDVLADDLQLLEPAPQPPAPVTVVAGHLHRGSPLSAGLDLHATEAVLIGSGCRTTVATGVRTRMQPGFVGLICDRSGLAANSGVTVLGGVIDADYELEWKAILFNSGSKPVAVAAGDRVAQAVFVPLVAVAAAEAGSVTTGPARAGGFGSSGN